MVSRPCDGRYIPSSMKEEGMPRRAQKRRVRAPDATRKKLLQAAFEEIYRRGFQGASLETILAAAGVTKGALYHHFQDKAALGYAVVDEVVKGLLLERWLTLLERSEEHTSELQSQSNLVCRLLLVKKKDDDRV